MNIAVMSDLHATESEGPRRVSWLCGNTSRDPVAGHPVESLIDLIQEEAIEADFVFVPGDITDQCNLNGFQIAWNAIDRVSRFLGATRILATTGNHDVDSRKLHTDGEPFEPVRSQIGRDYPLGEAEACRSFWASHFALIIQAPIAVLVLNSCADHHNESEAKHGRVSEATLEHIEHELSQANIPDETIRVALCHHHPHPHSGIGLPDSELMDFGDRFLALLSKYEFGLLVHGHKHHPSLEYAAGGIASTAVFAAGSFSATMPVEMATRTRNLFHLVTLDVTSGSLRGEIRSWQFHYLRGWTPSTMSAAEFPSKTGFGYRGDQEQLAKDIAARTSEIVMPWDEIEAKIPEVKFLIPADFVSLEQRLKGMGVQISRDHHSNLFQVVRTLAIQPGRP